MIKVYANEFVKFVAENFSEEEGEEVQDFYRNYLIPNPSRKKDYSQPRNMRTKKDPLHEVRYKNLSALVKDYGKDIVILSIQKFKHLYNRGEIDKNKTFLYFDVFIKNELARHTTKWVKDSTGVSRPIDAHPQQEKLNNPDKVIVVPTPYQRISDFADDFSDVNFPFTEINNWTFKCDCGSLIPNSSQEKCRKCNAKFDFSSFTPEILKTFLN